MSGPLLPLNGLTVCYMALPTIVGTFFKHCIPPKDSHLSNRPELALDEALSVTRSMAEKLTQYPIEDVQRLANTFQPTPWNARVIRVSIPASICSSAAEYLIAAFGPAELKHVIGGRQWWQLRSNEDGSINGEWIAMKRHLPRPTLRSPSKSSPSAVDGHSPQASHSKQKGLLDSLCSRHSKSTSKRSSSSIIPGTADIPTASPEHDPELIHEPALLPDSHTLDPTSAQAPNHDTDQSSSSSENAIPSDTYEDDLDQMPCLLYIHGGGYYFGSVNTYRYSIVRYTRKMGGRAFAVNYRHAPQYPFPCALMDCLAAYLYLIQPPEDAKHRAIDPSKIVIAGDSAGGGLSLALLTLIRDVGLPLPAGAVLISPWVDLTHSFPSIMSNADKDIIPPYGFMHQPSVLWPPSSSEIGANLKESSPPESSSPAPPETAISQSTPSSNSNIGDDQNPFKLKVSPELKVRVDHSDGNAPIVEFDDGEVVVMNQQIQFYATNDQLTHPYCSPLFSPSLGGLPPLFIIAGQNEVLRDEIIYMAHRAAHPDRYPLREDLLNAHAERKAKADQYPPTQVHLQVYDDVFHVLPLFSFLRPAKYCYRAIGSFCKFVTDPLKKENHSGSLGGLPDGSINLRQSSSQVEFSQPRQLHTPPSSPEGDIPLQIQQMSIAALPRIKPNAAAADPLLPDKLAELKHTIYHASLPHQRPDFKDGMIRERVAFDGKIRPLEDETELEFLKILPEELGFIKAGPLRRWAEGRKIWYKKFMRKHNKIQHQREYQIKRSKQRVKKGLKALSKSGPSKQETVNPTHQSQDQLENSSAIEETSGTDGARQTMVDFPNIRLGWFLSEEERPPPCSAAARHDNVESLKLNKVLQRQHNLKNLNVSSHVAAA